MAQEVLITGARAPVAIDLARSFRAAGYAPVLADSVTPWAAKASTSAPTRRHPPPRQEFAGFAAWLSDYVERADPALIVPTCEEVFYVSAAAQKGGFAERVFAPPLDALRTLHSKVDFARLLDRIGVDTPETWRVRSRAELQALPISPTELVLKPEFSRFGTATRIKPTHAQLTALKFKNAWAAQRYIEGEEICLWSAARHGAVVAHAAYRPIWRHGRSAGYAFEYVDHPPALEIARIVASATNHTGHLSFDLIVTPDGRTLPIECNPRAVSGLHLCDAQAGLARRIMGEAGAPLPMGDRRHLSLAMMCLGLPTAISTGRIGRFLSDWRASGDVLGRPGDRGPVAGALLDAVRFAMLGLRRRHSPTAETTDDIEWNGEPLL